MKENIFDKYLNFKKVILTQYIKKTVNVLLKEKVIDSTLKKEYLAKTIDVTVMYVDNFYFSLNEMYDDLKEIISVYESDNEIISFCATISHVVLQIDRLNNPIDLKKFTLGVLKTKVANLFTLLNIHINKKSKEFNELIKIIKMNYHTENKFFKELSELDIYNVFDEEPYIKNTYFVHLKENLLEINKEYNENLIEEVKSSTQVQKKFDLISLQQISLTILKELLVRKRLDNFIIKISDNYFKDNNFNEIKKIINNDYLKRCIFFLVEDKKYLKKDDFFAQLKEENYNFMIDVNNSDTINRLNEELIIYTNLSLMEVNNLKNNKNFVIEKYVGTSYSELELLNGLMEE